MPRKKTAVAFIPFKRASKRVKRKNFRPFMGHPLYAHIISTAVRSKSFDQIYVNTDSHEIQSYASGLGLGVIDRPPHLNADRINGNDLLNYDAQQVNEGDLLFQLFGTAPLLSATTIHRCVNILKRSRRYDSIFTATQEAGWYWFKGYPVNFMPHAFPRSQDAERVVKESTGLYGIRRSSLEKYQQRIGARPYIYLIPKKEAFDIDTEFDWKLAESVARDSGYRGDVL